MEWVMSGLGMLRRWGRRLGPYLMLEILLPGGTLFALLLFLYRRGEFDVGGVATRIALMWARTLASLVE